MQAEKLRKYTDHFPRIFGPSLRLPVGQSLNFRFRSLSDSHVIIQSDFGAMILITKFVINYKICNQVKEGVSTVGLSDWSSANDVTLHAQMTSHSRASEGHLR